MTPAINFVKKSKIDYKIHEYHHDSSEESYGLEAAKKLLISEKQVFKTLVVNIGTKEFGVAVVPVSSKLSMKRFAKALGVKKADMAKALDVERVTGYVLGGVSPLGQKKRLKTVVDISAVDYKTIFVSAGRRGLEIELSPKDLISFLSAKSIEICQ